MNYHPPKNPYNFSKPIYKKEDLYGRKDITDAIQYNFNNNIKITLLHVQRRIGKTSLITCLPQFFTEEQNSFHFVTFSFQGYKRNSVPKILNYLADDIAATIPGLPREVREEADTSYNFFQRFLPRIINEYLSGKKLVLLLDEFDVLEEDTTISTRGKKLFDELEKAVQEEEKLFAILVFGRPLKYMKYLEAFLKKGNQKTIEVGLLKKEDTHNLIVDPAKGILEYEDGAIDEIWQLSAGHPSITQLLCFCIFRFCMEKEIKKVADNNVELILNQAMTTGEVVFDGFIKPLNKNENFFFRAVAEAQEIGITDPLKIIKPNGKTPISALRQAGKSLAEYGFLENKGTNYKIKVELVRRWVLNNYPLLNKEDRKRKKTFISQPSQNKSNRPNGIAQLFAFVVIIGIFGIFAWNLTDRIRNSGDSGRTESDCFKLSEEINKALEDTTNQSQVIEKVRTEWSREKEGLLDKQCPYSYDLDATYNELLHRYGRSQVDTGNFEPGIEAFCDITSQYKGFSEIQNIFERWVLTDKRLANETKKRVLDIIIEQNESGNDCPAYSFKNDRSKNELYDQKAQVHAKDFEFEQAVESYCKITDKYYNFDAVVKRLEGWLSFDYYKYDLSLDDADQVEEKLKQLKDKDKCPVFPPSLNN